MRLLNTTTLDFVDCALEHAPPYVILSHTWGEEEVLFADIINGSGKSKKGWSKMTGATKKAQERGFQWIWIDTCCIDKSSSAELSEAINSMFKWYKASAVCHVYLQDVGDPKSSSSSSDYLADFTSSRWFSRGWTLQELLAPTDVRFYTGDWQELGTRRSLAEPISQRTRIPLGILHGGNPFECSVAERMSWAAGRFTTRTEDIAYCLLGLFGVTMPLLYGEGHAAFRRLQKHILSEEEDYSLLTWVYRWNFRPGRSRFWGCLTSHPNDFTRLTARPLHTTADGHTAELNLVMTPELTSYSIMSDTSGLHYFSASGVSHEVYASLVAKPQLGPGGEAGEPPTVTSRGLRLHLPVRHSSSPIKETLAFLNCECNGQLVCILLEPQSSKTGTVYARREATVVFLVDRSLAPEFELQSLYLLYDKEWAQEESSSGALRPHRQPQILTMMLGSPNGPTFRLLYSTVEPRDGHKTADKIVQRQDQITLLPLRCLWNATLFEVGDAGRLAWVLIACGSHQGNAWCCLKYESSYEAAMDLVVRFHNTRLNLDKLGPEFQLDALAQLGLDASRDRDVKVLPSLICSVSIDRGPGCTDFELRLRFDGLSELEPWARLLMRGTSRAVGPFSHAGGLYSQEVVS